MNFENSSHPIESTRLTDHQSSPVEQRENEMSPEDTLNYVIRLGEDIALNAKRVLAMFAEAQAQGVGLNMKSSQALRLFEPDGERQLQMLHILGDLNTLKVEIAHQGILMTAEQVNNRVAEMGRGESH